jgi:hypothetical protein
VCEACLDTGRPFIACSLACLTAHAAEAHADATARGPAQRVAAYQARVNRNVAENRVWYAGHRAHVTTLAAEASRGGDLCVLGAGNGSDLDLPALAARFAAIHLVDIDGEALARCRAGAPPALRDRLVLHEGVDLSGFTDRLDEWGEAFPTEADLGRAAQPAIHGVLRRLGRTFDVVVSTCALSQLAVPYHRAWILPATAWASLHAAVTAVHLATIAGATTPGGTGLLVFDVLSSQKAPELRALDGASPEALASFVERQEREGGHLEPDPRGLLARLGALGRLVTSPRLTEPWLWNIGAETQLVYGLVFSRA